MASRGAVRDDPIPHTRPFKESIALFPVARGKAIDGERVRSRPQHREVVGDDLASVPGRWIEERLRVQRRAVLRSVEALPADERARTVRVARVERTTVKP